MSLNLGFYTVDAFTQEPFSGNAAAIFVLPPRADPTSPQESTTTEITDELCQKIANEFNLAETAFTRRLQGTRSEDPTYSLRFWTPT